MVRAVAPSPVFLEAVGRCRGDVDEVSRAGVDRLVAETELDLALEQVEGLVLARVDVRRRAAAGRHERLHREVRAAGLLAGDEERVVVAGAPVRRGPWRRGGSGYEPWPRTRYEGVVDRMVIVRRRRHRWRVFLECRVRADRHPRRELQAEAGMNLRSYDVLVDLEEAEHPVRMNELASRILASKSGLTRVIDRMEEAGLVERRVPPDNRRSIVVEMTPKGAEALQAARRVPPPSGSTSTSPSTSTSELSKRSATSSRTCTSTSRPLRPGRISGSPRGALSDARHAHGTQRRVDGRHPGVLQCSARRGR